MKDRLLGTREIKETLNCGRTFAYELMQKFRARGQTYKVGNRSKVPEKVFTDWMEHESKQPGIRIF